MQEISLPSDYDKSLAPKPICGVMATAVVCGLTFHETFNYFKKIKPPTWRGSLHLGEINNAINSFGTKIKKSLLYTKQFRSKRVIEFVTYVALIEPESIFVVYTRKHVLVVQGPKIIDQGGIFDYTRKFEFSKQKIEAIFVINPNVLKSEVKEKIMKSPSKYQRSIEIIRKELQSGKSRKDILFKLSEELDTTWNAATTFYYRAKKLIEQKEVA